MNQIVQIVLGSFLLLFLMVLVYQGRTVYLRYKDVYKIKEEKIELNDGNASEIEMPQSLLGNDYSVSMILTLSDKTSDRPMPIVKRGGDLAPNLQINLLPGKDKTINELEFVFKLQGNTLPNYEKNILDHPEVKQIISERQDLKTRCKKLSEDDPLKELTIANTTKPTENFYNYINKTTQNLHQKFKSIYSPELFKNISLESFDDSKKETNHNHNEKDHLMTHSHEHSHDDLNGHSTTDIKPEYDRCVLYGLPNKKNLFITLVVVDNVVDIYESGKLKSSCNLRGFPETTTRPFEFIPDLKGKIHKFIYINKGLNQTKVNSLYNDMVESMKKNENENENK